jgi:hypothetical protein
MGFMSVPQGGDFIPYVKYDARAGRWFTKSDSGDVVEVANATFVVDLENLKTGWFHYEEGQAPQVTLDPSLTEAAPKPNADAKRGFRVLMHSDKNLGGLREFTSTAAVVIEAFNGLYDAYQAGKGANAGKLPVVKAKGVTAVKSAKSTNYQPVLEIVQWVDRPAAFDEAGGDKEAAPAVTQATPAMATAGADDDTDF